MSRFVSVILCFTVVSMTGTDLNTGMVVCFDDRGNFAIEASACKACARARGGGEHHGHDDAGIDPDHEVLHEAIASRL